MNHTLIITTYNWPESLFLVLESIKLQSILPDEIIIADDGSDQHTKDFIEEYIKKSNLNILHSWQKDRGFRAARSRNKAIGKSKGEYIILIDGDTILHPDFIRDHLQMREQGCFIQGTRVLLSKALTKKTLENELLNFPFYSVNIKNRKNAVHSNILAKVFSHKQNHLNGIKSCNMSFYKNDCLKINGFNNNFEGWGREDSEFVARMIFSGLKRKNVRFNAIQFHLWHNENDRISIKKNDLILSNTIKNCIKRCENGIDSIDFDED